MEGGTQNGSIVESSVSSSPPVTINHTDPSPTSDLPDTSTTSSSTTEKMVTTTSTSNRKSEHHQQHRVTFVECNNTEHGPPTDNEEEERFNQTVITTKTSKVISINPEMTDSGYTDSIISTQENNTTTTIVNGDVVDSPTSTSTVGEGIPKPVLRITRTRSTESHDNPFLAEGDLSKKAESIIRHSTISRTELKIYDPDKAPPEPAVEEPLVAAQSAPAQQAAPPTQNGSVEEPLTPKSVEVEVSNTEKPQEQKAEEVKVDKGKKCKCCVLQ